jgi:hypothetical protein
MMAGRPLSLAVPPFLLQSVDNAVSPRMLLRNTCVCRDQAFRTVPGMESDSKYLLSAFMYILPKWQGSHLGYP